MGLGFLLIPALVGYWVQVNLYQDRYEITRLSGHHVVFRAALTGIWLTFFSHIIVLILRKYCSEFILLLQEVFPFEYSDTAVISFLIGFLYWKVSNMAIDKQKAVATISKAEFGFVGAKLTYSIQFGKLVEVTLNTRKVYIGLVIDCGIGKGEYDVEILPFFSGYREEKTNEINIVRNYLDILKARNGRVRNGVSVRELTIAFPISQVVSVRLFNIDVYSELNSKGSSEATTTPQSNLPRS